MFYTRVSYLLELSDLCAKLIQICWYVRVSYFWFLILVSIALLTVPEYMTHWCQISLKDAYRFYQWYFMPFLKCIYSFYFMVVFWTMFSKSFFSALVCYNYNTIKMILNVIHVLLPQWEHTSIMYILVFN